MSDESCEPPLVVALVANLFFLAPITDAVRAAGAEALVVDTPAELAGAIERWPSLVLIDLGVTGDWQSVVHRAKMLPQTRAIPIVGFGSHMDVDALRAARAVGCDHVWARSRFVNELPELLQRSLYPEVRQPDGWNEPPPLALRNGIAEFNQGKYWECHETLEALWRAEQRPIRDLYQGILQIGVAFHHLHAGNHTGALKMLRRGLPRLRGLPEVCQGVPVAKLAHAAHAIHDQIAAIDPAEIGQFDLSKLPRIELMETPRAGNA